MSADCSLQVVESQCCSGDLILANDSILFLKQFLIAADMPDDHTARSHRREREAYAQLIDSEK
jgi:hypothetical protein